MLTPTETPWLLDKLCVDAGFCPSPEEKEKREITSQSPNRSDRVNQRMAWRRGGQRRL
jgi:hypothetical protein